MNWKDNINTLKEIYDGHYQIILDFATNDFIKFALSDEYKYVWVYSHETKNSLNWNTYELPLSSDQQNYKMLARNISFDFIMPTNDFKTILPIIGPGITLTQLNVLPKYYLRPVTIKGKTRYDLLLNECDYLFEIDIPSATDYGTIRSSDRDYLQSLLENEQINWDDLP
ncbi:hypothetical protein [Mucilaginibacter arboris]|uniref:Uncharacterized protein n=1 Tax=Mucilaginibacter arboris TaxID=2682090 RepID=A0A7K1T203_9SPHI|nr:hypothetical protein [Mucilaginibacter arboris]MVN23557.1 hypothetical protein [Mucilaginibacter arboris]